MFKIGISGKARSGKDTFARFLSEIYGEKTRIVSLAAPIKEMVMLMFPRTDREILFGASENRSQIIPGAFLDGKPLSYRVLLQILGSDFGRKYNPNIWIDIINYKQEQAERDGIGLFIVSDVRFCNEISQFKNSEYNLIRIKKKDQELMDHPSETEQDSIPDSEFQYIINNNYSLNHLRKEAEKIINLLGK